MRFLFSLDLSLHAGAGIFFFGILIFETKHGVNRDAVRQKAAAWLDALIFLIWCILVLACGDCFPFPWVPCHADPAEKKKAIDGRI